jgi:fimbrial isopeptide formation D2 family protein/LPXTG-motif cell wall-anchored protein
MCLSLVLALGLCGVASAAETTETTENTGTITINNANTGASYDIYRILDLKSYDTTREAYLYKTNDDWKAFIEAYNTEHKIVGNNNNIGYPIELDGTGNYVISASFTAESFASEALAYATTNNIAPNATQVATSSTLKFTGLQLGYYLVSSGAGSLLVLSTTSPNMTITEKNDSPTVEKKIIIGSSRAEETTATIGDTIWFRTNISAKAGAKNYVLHDKMDSGLTLDATTVKVMDEGSVDLGEDCYELVTAQDELTDGCTFELKFDDDYLKTISEPTIIRVHYAAVLNTNAQVAEKTPAVKVNQNTAYLGFGEDRQTGESVVTVKSFRYQIIKMDSKENVLSGAKFQLYRNATDTEPMRFTVDANGDSGGNVKYLVDPNGSVTEIEAGTPVIYGLGNGTYYLKEIKAPDGYNLVTESTAITVNNSSSMGTFTTADKSVYDITTGGGVVVVNNKGTLLPVTGGSGTVFIYIGGALLVAVGCLLLLRWRKREKLESR